MKRYEIEDYLGRTMSEHDTLAQAKANAVKESRDYDDPLFIVDRQQGKQWIVRYGEVYAMQPID